MEKIVVKMKPAGLEMDIDKEAFSLALKTWRLRGQMTQVQAGEKLGCSRYTIMRAESGKNITWEQAYRLFARLSEELRKEASHEW